jgi:hypothetical protein
MQHLPAGTVVLAAQTRWESLARGFKGRRVDSQELFTVLLILAAMVLLVWLLSLVANWRQRRGPYTSPLRLFFSLCRAHRLGWGEWWWLWRLARSQRLSDPARLFLEPERFEPSHLAAGLRGQAALFRRVRDRLFADSGGHAADKPPSRGDADRAGTPLLPTTPSSVLDVSPWIGLTPSDPGVAAADFRDNA